MRPLQNIIFLRLVRQNKTNKLKVSAFKILMTVETLISRFINTENNC